MIKVLITMPFRESLPFSTFHLYTVMPEKEVSLNQLIVEACVCVNTLSEKGNQETFRNRNVCFEG